MLILKSRGAAAHHDKRELNGIHSTNDAGTRQRIQEGRIADIKSQTRTDRLQIGGSGRRGSDDRQLWMHSMESWEML
jgi:hypothetical protein